MARHWQNLLRGMLENPQASVDSLPMLDAEERYQLLEGWNATAAEYPLQRGVHRLFEEQVERTQVLAVATPWKFESSPGHHISDKAGH